ncbi:hypothetical protein J2X32_000764 [Rheinheimera pacifica]|uniref:Ig-like domain-containing protein n=1 Tax=Rheinheimera pacifica TaxID=173990 RepID=UPI0028571ACA|nr:Ig-like domain-containing protein [Rheinheimera pacifica]MDR6982156.1 hypothetical protein [Rheinheimera pacifica]
MATQAKAESAGCIAIQAYWGNGITLSNGGEDWQDGYAVAAGEVISYQVTSSGSTNAAIDPNSGAGFVIYKSGGTPTDVPEVYAYSGNELNLNGTHTVPENNSNYVVYLWSGAANATATATVTCGTSPMPTVTDGNISISGATGIGGAYKIGDTVSATWNNTAGGDNNAGITGVTADFSQFGGGAAVAATNNANIWTASYTIAAGAIDATNRNVSITASNADGPTTTADTSNATVDNVAPTVTDARISISGGTGAGGAYIIGDTVTASWNNTAGGDNNSDTISNVTVNFSQFGGGTVAASKNANTWTATYTIVAGAIEASARNVSVTATDNAGNATTTADTSNADVDNTAPVVASVNVPANGIYLANQSLDFTVNTNENIVLDTNGGTPRIALTVGVTTRYAIYLSGSGTSAVVFRYTVQSGDLDANGITVAGVIDANGGTLKDSAGNNMNLVLNNVGSTAAVLVDGLTAPDAPTIGTAVAGNAQASVTFTAPGNNGGSAITTYTATASPGGATGNCAGPAACAITVNGLTNGTAYTFTVTATNTKGTSVASAASNAVTPKGEQTITFNNPGAQNFGTTPTLTATSSAGAGYAVSFSSTTAGVCTITSGGTLTFVTAGSCTINADQPGDAAINAATTVTQSFAVNAIVPEAPTIGTATAGDTEATVAFTAPANTGGTTITGYTVTSNPGGFTGTGAGSPITVSGLTNGVAYTFTVTATNSAGTGAASAASNSIIPASPQTITFTNPGAQNFGTTPTLTATSSAGAGYTVTFTSSTPGVCTITSGGTLTFVTAGTCTINADQAGDSSFLPASQVSRSFTVNPVVPNAPTIGTAIAGDTQASVAFVAPVNIGGAAITGYTVTVNPADVAPILGASSPIVVTGLTNGQAYTFTVTADNVAGTSPASAASNSVTPAAIQTITFNNPGAQNFATTPTLTATSDSGLTPTFTSSTPAVCTITSDGALTFITAGSCTINADQAGNGSYLPATQVSRTFTVNPVVPGAPTAVFATAGDATASVAFAAPVNTGGVNITGYTVTSNPGGLTASGAGSPLVVNGLTNGTPYTFTVTATNAAGTSTASAASADVTPSSAQTITFANPGAQSFGTTPTLTAEASSGLPVSFTSSTTAVCDITAGGTLSFSTVGSCTINANQLGNASFQPATAVSHTFTVNAVVPAAPTSITATIGDTTAAVAFVAPTFNGGAPITNYIITSSPGGLTASGTSSPITVSSLTNGTSYTFTAVAVNSVGSSTPSAPSSAIVPVANQSITFADPGSQAFGSTPTLVATASSGLAVTFSSSTAAVCTVSSSGTLAFVTIGTCTISADQPGDAAYLAAPQINRSFSVTAVAPGAPTIGAATALSGTEASVTFSAPAFIGGSEITSYTVTSSPDNLSASGNGSPITITGMSGGKAYTFTVKATNAAGMSVASAASNSITLNSAPEISGTPPTQVSRGNAYLFTPVTTDAENDSLTFSISNKPTWASFSTTTGELSGTPTRDDVGTTTGIVISVSDGEFSASLSAFNIEVTAVNDAPEISGSPLTSINQDQAYSFVPTASDPDDDTLTFSITNKPTWASFDTATGALTGTPVKEYVGTTTGVLISVSDGEYSAALAAFNLTVVNVNETPVISGVPVTNINQDQAYSFVPTASDPDDDTLIFSITNKPTWASFDTATGALTGTPAKEHVGTTTGIVISVSDGEYNAALPAFNLTVVNVNETPVISGTPETSVNEDETYSFVPTASDPDDDTLTFSITNKPTWASFDTATGALTGTPAKEHVGITTGIVISVSDGEFTASLNAFNLEVINVNAAPVAVDDNFTLPFSNNHTYLLDVLANDTDPDEDSLTITAAKASIGLVSIQSNKLLFTAPDNFSGTASFSYSITDGELSDMAQVTLQIDGSNPDAPVITAPDDLIVNASGLFTKVNVGVATAVDRSGNRLGVSLVNGLPMFAAGRHELYWRATDGSGISSTVTQLLQINPLVSLSKPQTVINNSTVTIEVILNGPAPVYPLEVAYSVSGSASAVTEHNLAAGSVQLSSGLRASISFDVFADLTTQAEKDIVVTLNSSLNLGANASTTITATEANLAPVVVLDALQQGENRLTVGKTAGVVTISAQVSDPNPGDAVSQQWQADAAVTNISADASQFIFEPASLSRGVYRISLTATDNAAEPLSSTAEIYLLVQDVLPILDGSDSNNNLIPDNVEGFGDSNSNGIPNYLDPGFDCNVIPEQLASIVQFVAEGEPGICLRKGAAAALSNTGGIQLAAADQQWLEPDMQATNIGGSFDFILHSLPSAGASYRLVLPQRQPVPQNAVYRKYTQANGWTNFVQNARNQLFSAAGEPGFCPPPGDSSWQAGLNAGHWCVQLQIEDGGANDADGLANGTIVDPGGVAVVLNGNQLPVAADDSYSVQWNQSHTLEVLQNDTDPDGDTLSINQAAAAFGNVSISDDGLTLLYTPAQDFIGTDTLSYGVSDGNNGSASATVTVAVYFNRPPVVTNATASTNDKTAIDIDVLANASDPDGDALVISSASAQNGTVTITAAQTLRYTPQAGFAGTDTISFTVTDNRGGSVNGTVTISITAYEVITVVNKSSGGAVNGWPMLLLAGMAVIRQRKALLKPVLILAALFSCNTQAHWSVDTLFGKSTTKQSASEINQQLPSGTELLQYDDSGKSWALGLSYYFTPRLAVQAHYVDLGDASVSMRGETLTPEAFHQAVSDIGPMLAKGVRSGLSYHVWQHAGWSATVQAGVFAWNSETNSTAGDNLIRYKTSDTDIYWALGASYALDEHIALQAVFNRYHLEGNKADNIMLGVSYSF